MILENLVEFRKF